VILAKQTPTRAPVSAPCYGVARERASPRQAPYARACPSRRPGGSPLVAAIRFMKAAIRSQAKADMHGDAEGSQLR